MTKDIPLSHSIISLILTLFFIVLSIILGFSAFWGILGGIVVCIIFGLINGHKLKELLIMAIEGIKDAYIVLIIMSLIGVIIGIWMICGTIPTLMYYGFDYLSGSNFVFTSFIITCFMSLILGTSIGTISIIGIPLIGISVGLGIPPYITAGAIVSGAFLGDRTSPMSSSANLISVITKTDLYENIKCMVLTLIPTLVISLVFYYLIGKNYILSENTITRIESIKLALEKGFQISPILLLPPLVIIVMSFFRINIKYNLVVGILLGGFLGFVYQDNSIIEVIRCSIGGFHSSNLDINKIISGGGFWAMRGILSIVTSATGLYGILEGTGIINPVLERFTSNIKSIPNLIVRTCLLSIVMNVVTLNQTLSIIIPGKSMASSYEQLGVSRNILARTISDSGTVIAPLIPWNINGLVISVTLGINVIKYSPFAILCFTLPIVTIIHGHLAIAKE